MRGRAPRLHTDGIRPAGDGETAGWVSPIRRSLLYHKVLGNATYATRFAPT